MRELTCSLVTYDDSVEWYPKTRCYGFLPKKNILFTSFICEIIMSLSIITRWGIGRIFDIIHFICKNVLSRYKQVQLHSNDTISWNRIHVWCKKVNLFSILSCISQKVTSMDKYLDECRRLMRNKHFYLMLFPFGHSYGASSLQIQVFLRPGPYCTLHDLIAPGEAFSDVTTLFYNSSVYKRLQLKGILKIQKYIELKFICDKVF